MLKMSSFAYVIIFKRRSIARNVVFGHTHGFYLLQSK